MNFSKIISLTCISFLSLGRPAFSESSPTGGSIETKEKICQAAPAWIRSQTDQVAPLSCPCSHYTYDSPSTKNNETLEENRFNYSKRPIKNGPMLASNNISAGKKEKNLTNVSISRPDSLSRDDLDHWDDIDDFSHLLCAFIFMVIASVARITMDPPQPQPGAVPLVPVARPRAEG